jgi:hypothetical protein
VQRAGLQLSEPKHQLQQAEIAVTQLWESHSVVGGEATGLGTTPRSSGGERRQPGAVGLEKAQENEQAPGPQHSGWRE